MAVNSNTVIHGMWVGTTLSKLELLTMHSFVRHGHEFHLWAYDDLSAYEFPRGVRLRNAEEIIPRSGVFAKRGRDRETGVGRNSFGAPFSDLFRYKLLYEHGGTWADMDVTCLRPFDFPGEYAFRPHRIGIVGSILKCPKGSPMMRKVYEETLATVDADTEWLTPNRILTKHAEAMGLTGAIIPNMSNLDNWAEFILPLIERPTAIPDDWYAIHWINEMWRTLNSDDGYYRGRRLLDYVPDKNAPREGSTLWELYRKYGLIDPRIGPSGRAQRPARLAKSPPPLPVTPLRDEPRTASALNILLPSLVRGGAERSVIETLSALRRKRGLSRHLFVVHRSRRQYAIAEEDSLKVSFGTFGADVAVTLRGFALEILKSPAPTVYTHLIPAKDLRVLWDMGITTIPVIQNARPGWNDPPDAFDSPNVPFIVAVSDAVADELREAGSPRPVVSLRHELQRVHQPEVMARHRREIRNQFGIGDNTLLVGMVGQFKSQKAYTRAVRVLARLNEIAPAKLAILGGWDHQYGGGRAAYEATCRLAVDLGVIADMIMPGDVSATDPYLAAFDVFLNTSIYEGLSVALLEAIATGCPIVTADAGGNREVLPANSVLVEDGSDIERYVEGILALAGNAERVLPERPVEPTLVGQLWALIARHGIANSLARPGAPSGTLFITEVMNIGGPQQSLANLLTHLDPPGKRAICVLKGSISAAYKPRLDEAQIPVYSADGAEGIGDRAERVLNLIDSLNVRNVCFWNVAPELKLMVTKVLEARDAELFDVSPGPMLFDELKAAAPFGKRVSLGEAQYFARLDGFVAKYADGLPPAALAPDRRKLHVIPNGVAAPPSFVPLPPPEFLLPEGFDPNLAIGTCCRIVPDKKIEFLLDMMLALSPSVPGASLTIVGGPDSSSQDYFAALAERARALGLDNVFFAGEHGDVHPFLGQFRVFAMVSDREGCPNASLEAMAMGVPVVARTSPAVAEQIADGVNGFLVSSAEDMAARIATLLTNDRLRTKQSKAARDTALRQFSLEAMTKAYAALFDDSEKSGAAPARKRPSRPAAKQANGHARQSRARGARSVPVQTI
jgi:glycosyltransferase involved in cell wall biosynthesis